MATTSDADVQLELGGALAPPLDARAGLTPGEVGACLKAARRVIPDLLGPRAESGFLKLPRRRSVLAQVAASARRWRRRKPEHVIHVGIGGSSLGAEAIFRALAHPLHNELPASRRPGPRVHFVDNVDPERLAALLDAVDLRRSLVHVVSKSGGTVETAAGFQVVREALEQRVRGRHWSEQCVFTTGRGALRELGRREGVEMLTFPEDIGGRFSALTPSGLLTPAIAGLPVARVVDGARRMAGRLARLPLRQNPAAVSAAVCHLLGERGRSIHVLMAYSDAFEPLTRWYVQLAGESLGKLRGTGARAKPVGITPLAARGTTDQHSQVQLFVEGPADKLVTFLVAAKTRPGLRVGGEGPAPYLAGVELGRLLRAEQRGTAVALARAGRPSTTWVMPRASAESLGQLMLALETQVAVQATLLEVNAYDQPGVEAGKVAAFALIGREGYEAEAEAIAAAEPPRWTL